MQSEPLFPATFPTLGQDDKLREREQNLNYNPRVHYHSYIILKTRSPEQTMNLFKFTNQLPLKLRVDPSLVRNFKQGT